MKALASVDVTWKCPSPKVTFGIVFAATSTVDEIGNVPHLLLLAAAAAAAVILFINLKAA